MSSVSKALENLVVLDFSRFISGPFCAMMFADLGAEVIKVEGTDASGDPLADPLWAKNAGADYFPHDRNKKSISLDLRDARAVEIIKKLLPHIDVVVENAHPGVMAELGLSYEDIKPVNPRIIMTSISGFGQTGPYRDRASLDSIIQAEGGMTDSIMLESGGKPYLVSGHICDYIAALYGGIATLAAVRHRNITGEGQHIDVSMLTSMASFFSTNLATYGYCGDMMEPKTDAPCCYARTKDGYLRINSHVDVMWERTLKIIDDPDLHDPKYSDMAERVLDEPFLCEVIERWTSQHTCTEVQQIFGEAGITLGVVRSIDMLHDDPHLQARGQIVSIDVPGIGKLPFFGSPLHLPASKVDYRPAPSPGQHNAEVLKEYLHMDDEQIKELRSAGVVG